jgi:hypothetical protein
LLEPVVEAAGLLGDAAVALVAASARAVERDAEMRAGGDACLEHLFDAGVDAVGDLRDRRRAAELALEFRGGVLDGQRAFLERPRNAYGPAFVAEVALELPGDGRHGVGRERAPAGGVVALDGVEQTERGDLHEVLGLSAAAVVAAGEVLREREEPLDQRVPCLQVAVLAIAHEQTAVFLDATTRSVRCRGAFVGGRPRRGRRTRSLRCCGPAAQAPGIRLGVRHDVLLRQNSCDVPTRETVVRAGTRPANRPRFLGRPRCLRLTVRRRCLERTLLDRR